VKLFFRRFLPRDIAVAGLALVLPLLSLALRAFGATEHASVLAGMARSPSSIWIGPLVAVSYFASVTLVPIVLVGLVADVCLRRRSC